jgi:hypothetical protein
LIASFAVLKLLRNNVYVSITACFVNWKYKIKYKLVEISLKQDSIPYPFLLLTLCILTV